MHSELLHLPHCGSVLRISQPHCSRSVSRGPGLSAHPYPCVFFGTMPVLCAILWCTAGKFSIPWQSRNLTLALRYPILMERRLLVLKHSRSKNLPCTSSSTTNRTRPLPPITSGSAPMSVAHGSDPRITICSQSQVGCRSMDSRSTGFPQDAA